MSSQSKKSADAFLTIDGFILALLGEAEGELLTLRDLRERFMVQFFPPDRPFVRMHVVNHTIEVKLESLMNLILAEGAWENGNLVGIKITDRGIAYISMLKGGLEDRDPA
ncbi:hypothetical protein ACFL11_00660 [Patescibacteria group bacterium]